MPSEPVSSEPASVADPAADLFPGQHTIFSPCRQWRYFLRRPWAQQVAEGFAGADLFTAGAPGRDRPPVAFCLLNPSTADEAKDDPTVARCRRFAVRWGYGDCIVLNAFAYRATDPRNMKAFAEPVGEDNDRIILKTVDHVLGRGGLIVCGWGNHGAHLNRGQTLRELLGERRISGFPLTGAGEPGHPLYLKNTVAVERL